jgi:glutamate racemase
MTRSEPVSPPWQHPQSSSRPDLRGAIGVFDSGVGGLSVLRAIRRALPLAHLVYVADSGHAPYGDKPAQHIIDRTLALGLWLAGQGVQAITVACNTATVTAVHELRQQTHLPVVAIEPAIKPAVSLTQNGVVGVLATQQTIQSESVSRLVQRHGHGVEFVLQACPGWVEQVEKGALDDPQTVALVRQHLQPLLDRQADVWVLGCTHFPFLTPLLRSIAGTGVQLVDPAEAVARELVRRLQLTGMQDVPADRAASETFLTTGDTALADRVMSALWGRPVSSYFL